MAKKKRRVPEVLWRLFRDSARTLADTIVSLIPSLSEATKCRCKGQRCLGCSGENAMSFLLRPDDPSDYRKLLTNCFVVVSQNAPPIDTFYPDRRRSQIQIVRRAIDTLLCASTNVLCSGFDKRSRSSLIVELLTCSAWVHLLKRVGDDLMFYLLRNSSIFLPLPHKKHHQVAGPPISHLCHKSSQHMSESEYQHPSILHLGSRKKRRTIDGVSSLSEREQVHTSSCCAVTSSFVNKTSSCNALYSGHCKGKHNLISSSEEILPRIGHASAYTEGDRIEELQQSSNQNTVRTKKRVRQFSWQRRRKRRHISFPETSFLNPCTGVNTDKESLSERLQCDPIPCLSNYHEKMPSQCSCCLVLDVSEKVSEQAQINRHSIFYNLECSLSVFPRSHILNSLMPNSTGAKFLVRNIFGLSDVNITSHLKACLHRSGSCHVGPACLYHSLLKMHKTLIRRAQCCQHLRLLDKHCAVPNSLQNVNPHAWFIHEANESQTSLIDKEHAIVWREGDVQMEKSLGFDSTHCNKSTEPIDNLLKPNKSYCSKSQVVSFIWAVCRSIVPPDLLGTTSNWRIWRRNIYKFICLRRFEKFSLRQCMHKLKTSKFTLLSNQNSSGYLSNHTSMDMLNQDNKLTMDMKHRLLKSWIFWFFSCLVVPLVQANFYVTESEYGKQDVFYYRKSIWQRLTKGPIDSLKDRSYVPLDDASVRSILSHRSFGFSKLRLRPKEDGVRVLANLKASSRIPSQVPLMKYQSCRIQSKPQLLPKSVKFKYFKSVNSVLRDLHAVLKGLQLKEPDKLGASVFDYNDVYKTLCPFILGLKNGSPVMPSVFVVVSDVVKAFDSIDQDKLLSVMKNLILQDEYFLRQSHQVVCTKKSLLVRENLTSLDHSVSGDSTKSKFPVFFRSMHSVLVSQKRSRNIRKRDLYFNLAEHVKHNVLQLDKKFYLQEVGIPQGSVLSSLLCSFYYGHLERNVIYPFLEKGCDPASENLSGCTCHDVSSTESCHEADISSLSPKYLLLRFVDDILFISTSKRQAASFFTRLQRGFREYNCYMNKEKSCLNFDTDHVAGFESNRVYVGGDGISFLRWSGLLINCCSLEVQADYTRYLNIHLSSTLTVCWQDKPGRHLKDKLCSFMRPKCHPIFYDSNINSPGVVRLNIYQSFLLSAMKFHCYVRDLSYVCKLRTRAYLRIIERSFRYMHTLIRRRMCPVNLGSNFHPILELEKGEVEWLGLNAFVRVLKRKQSRHKELLSLLRPKLLVNRISQDVSSQLKYAVDESHSSIFWKIEY